MGQLMFRKFPQIARYAPTEMEQLVLFRITPEIISVLDYRKGFGHTRSRQGRRLKGLGPEVP